MDRLSIKSVTVWLQSDTWSNLFTHSVPWAGWRGVPWHHNMVVHAFPIPLLSMLWQSLLPVLCLHRFYYPSRWVTIRHTRTCKHACCTVCLCLCACNLIAWTHCTYLSPQWLTVMPPCVDRFSESLDSSRQCCAQGYGLPQAGMGCCCLALLVNIGSNIDFIKQVQYYDTVVYD